MSTGLASVILLSILIYALLRLRSDSFEYYVGPQSWPKWSRMILPFAREFSASGQYHDFAYSKCESEEERLRIDRFFLKLMLARIASMGIIWKFPAVITAYAYYCLVRIFGKRHTKYGKQTS